jgi:hypothetical protein
MIESGGVCPKVLAKLNIRRKITNVQRAQFPILFLAFVKVAYMYTTVMNIIVSIINAAATLFQRPSPSLKSPKGDKGQSGTCTIKSRNQ